MKLVKKLVLPVLFVSVLAVNTYAGEVETPGYVPPPPPPIRSLSYDSTTDKTTAPTELTDSTDDLSDNVVYDAITILLSMF